MAFSCLGVASCRLVLLVQGMVVASSSVLVCSGCMVHLCQRAAAQVFFFISAASCTYMGMLGGVFLLRHDGHTKGWLLLTVSTAVASREVIVLMAISRPSITNHCTC